MSKKVCLVLGAGGFIFSWMVKRLKEQGHFVVAVDRKYPEYSGSPADEFIIGDLRDYKFCESLFKIYKYDEVFMGACEMGGAGYVFSKINDSEIIYNSALMNLNIAKLCSDYKVGKVFFSSSACKFGEDSQMEAKANELRESDSWKSKPDSVYGIEKLFSEQVYDSFRRNKGLNIRVGIFHNIFGEESCYNNGREKYHSSICRKVAMAKEGESVEVWGLGTQVRSFLYIQEALEGIERLMNSEHYEALNIGSNEAISVNNLAKMVIDISGKNLSIVNVESDSIGVQGRSSNNELCQQVLNWSPSQPLRIGMEKLYKWVDSEINKQKQANGQ